MQMLSTPPIDDPMETDADRRGGLGEDIDIDIDFNDALLDEEDEFMNEGEMGSNQPVPATAQQLNDGYKDDEMVDQGNHEEVLYDSTSLQDEDIRDIEEFVGEPQLADNELVGVGDEEGGKNIQGQASQQYNGQTGQEQNGDLHGHDLTLEQNENALEDQGVLEGQGVDDVPDINEALEENPVLEAIHKSIAQDESPITLVNGTDSNQQKTSEQHEDTATQAFKGPQISVSYEDAELSLFRAPDSDQDFLLQDGHLFDASIEKLLAACKPVLGEDANDNELVLGVDDLDLDISEFATDAAVITVSQLNDVFLQLQRNDGIENPKNLHLNLYTRQTISDRLSQLRNAAETGVGLSLVSRIPEFSTDEDDTNPPLGQDERVDGNDDANLPTSEEYTGTHDQEDTLSTKSDTAILIKPTAKVTRSVRAAEEGSNKAEAENAEVGQSDDQTATSKVEDQNGVQGDSAAVQPVPNLPEDNQHQKRQELDTDPGEHQDDIINFEDQEGATTTDPLAVQPVSVAEDLPGHGHLDDLGKRADIDNPAITQPEDHLDEKDEITFDDEVEEQTKPVNLQQDQSLSPSSLKKRTRSDPDADDELVENEPQDAKRIRSD